MTTNEISAIRTSAILSGLWQRLLQGSLLPLALL